MSFTKSPRLRARPRRRGIAVLIALVCLGVCGAILGTLVREAILERQSLDSAQWREQAEWLARSGVDRAAASLARDRDYRSETWTIPAEALRGEYGGRVTIEVEKPAERSDVGLVSVVVVYPDRPDHRAQASRRVLISLSP